MAWLMALHALESATYASHLNAKILDIGHLAKSDSDLGFLYVKIRKCLEHLRLIENLKPYVF